jgi:hypothetical protein
VYAYVRSTPSSSGTTIAGGDEASAAFLSFSIDANITRVGNETSVAMAEAINQNTTPQSFYLAVHELHANKPHKQWMVIARGRCTKTPYMCFY